MKKISLGFFITIMTFTTWAASPTSPTTATPNSPVAPSKTVPNARDSYYTSGFYLGTNIGRAIADTPEVPGYDRTRTGYFGRAYIGYNANAYFSLDIGYVLLPTVQYQGNGVNEGITQKISTEGYDALATLKYPLGEGFVVYAKGGPALLRSRLVSPVPAVRQNATVLEYGSGIDYVWANVGGLHTLLDVTHINGKNDDTFNIPAYNLYSIGVYYQF